MTTSKHSILAGTYLHLPWLAIVFACGTALSQPTSTYNKTMDAADSLQGSDFDATVRATQKQSQAVTRAAMQTAPGQQFNYARNLLQSETFDNEAQRQKKQNSTVVSSATPALIEKVQKMLPNSAPYVGRLQAGEHVVVSSNGEEVIGLIRALATGTTTDQQARLLKLQSFSESGNPEAMNFMGVIFEHGLFGARLDMQRALSYYKSAAAARYQPAVYNLALAAAYNRDGGSGETNAFNLISKAAALGAESSYRVCGLGSFLSFRRNDQTAAINFSRNCFSALAGLSKASFSQNLTTLERVKLLRDSLATGADDAYAVIERVTRKDAATDQSYIYCKYALLNRFRQTERPEGLRNAASHCYRQFAKDTGNAFNNTLLHDQAVAGISGFIPLEIADLKKTRSSNHFHYSWSVPYLPFPQADVDIFEPLLSRAKS